MRLPRRKWRVQLVVVGHGGIVLSREARERYWFHSNATREMRRLANTHFWGYDGRRPVAMIVRIS
jgi:hypothetical protein